MATIPRNTEIDRSYDYVTSVKEFGEWVNGNQKWVQIFPFDTWDHPAFGETTVDRQKAERMIRNFNAGVLGTDVHTDYEHGQSKAHGTKASGKYLDLQIRDGEDAGLWGLIEFTEPAVREIDAGEWNYFSGGMSEFWRHPQTGQVHEAVIRGGGLTNHPWVKGMSPLNFSELVANDPEIAKEFSQWTTAYMNNLPDSSFLYIESGGKKVDGKTEPRSLRHFPVKDANGKVDLAHARNAIARAPQADVPDAVKSRVQATARRMLGSRAGNSGTTKEMSEMLAVDIREHLPKTYVAKRFSVVETERISEADAVVDGIGLEIVEDGSHGLLEITAEMAPQYYQEPGTGYADPLINHDDSADSGSRINTPPEGEDGTTPDVSKTVNPGVTGKPEPPIDSPDDADIEEQLPQVDPLDPSQGDDIEGDEGGSEIVDLHKEGGGVVDEAMVESLTKMDAELRSILSLDEDADLIGAVKGLTDEVQPLRDLKNHSEAQKQFSEQFPDEFARMARLEARDRENQAKEFSEHIGALRHEISGEGEGVKALGNLGLSAKSITAIEGLYKEFSESKATPTSFREVMETILGEGGLVDFGNIGSSREKEDLGDNPIKAFSEKIQEIQESDKVEYGVAIGLATQRFPDLAQAWSSSAKNRSSEN